MHAGHDLRRKFPITDDQLFGETRVPVMSNVRSRAREKMAARMGAII